MRHRVHPRAARTSRRRSSGVARTSTCSTSAATYDDELAKVASITHEHPGLGALAAGLVDGRQLDELTLFVIGDSAIALGALGSRP